SGRANVGFKLTAFAGPGAITRPEKRPWRRVSYPARSVPPARLSNSCSVPRYLWSGSGQMRVLGVDPGLTRCGLSVVESGRGRDVVALDVDVVRTPSDAPLSKRLLAISEAVDHWLGTHPPAVVGTE